MNQHQRVLAKPWNWPVFASIFLLACVCRPARAEDDIIVHGTFPDGSKLGVHCKDTGNGIAGLGKFTPFKGNQQMLHVGSGTYSLAKGSVVLNGKITGTKALFQIKAGAGQVAFTVLWPNNPPNTIQGTGTVSITDWSDAELDDALTKVLKGNCFTGQIQTQLTKRLGRNINPVLADTGRNLFFDSILGIAKDNSCAGCHSPLRGFGDTQPIAIGVGNNGIVGPGRTGPRNERRAPSVINAAFYPNLMWNSRFIALSGNPFDNRKGFQFPQPEGLTLSKLPTLLSAQAFLPVTEQDEMVGFDFEGTHDDMRAELTKRLNAIPAYRKLFGSQFSTVFKGGPITYDMVGMAIAEFEFSLVRANAPIDQFARGNTKAMTRAQKAGALLFWGKAGCIQCHKTAGPANEMFSDFIPHNIGVPQIVAKLTNADNFDGPNNNEDYGYEQVTGNAADRYKFRTAPLRNIGLAPFFMHDGAFSTLEDAIAHHLNPKASALKYTPVGRLPADLTGPTTPIAPILAQLDPLMAQPIVLTDAEFRWLVAFVRWGLLDPAATPAQLKKLIPQKLPSGQPVATFN
jgi:cytochrome c peroxidase